MKSRSISFVLAFILVSLSAASAQKSARITPDEYIKRYHRCAIKNMEDFGIPASITLAQGILESGSGNSYLAKNANNHFGIKCHGWKGKKVYRDDDKANECFRSYPSVLNSYDDHSEFLTSRSRYDFLFEYPSDDYKRWAKGLKKAGYATNPEYANLLINLIEKYDLNRFDHGQTIPGKGECQDDTDKEQPLDNPDTSKEERPIKYSNGLPYILAKKGDTYLSIAKATTYTALELATINDDKAYRTLQQGDIIYLERKRKKASKNHPTHITRQGESLRDIAQIYGVRLKKLLKYNRIKIVSESPLIPETIIYLRHKK